MPQDNTQPLARVAHVSKAYDRTWALKDLSFEVRAGETLGLLGPNGAGKTTAIHLLLGLLSPDGGEIRVLGMNPLHRRQELAPRVNFTSAYTTLPSNLNVQENLGLFARLYGVRDRRRKLGELMELFEIAHLGKRLTGALSSGERTRMNLCKCFLNDPDLVFLDEPTASLDPDVAAHTRGILKQLQEQRGTGILYTSHNMREVELLCDRVVFLHGGETVATGTPAELVLRYGAEDLEAIFIRIVREGRRPS